MASQPPFVILSKETGPPAFSSVTSELAAMGIINLNCDRNENIAPVRGGCSHSARHIVTFGLLSKPLYLRDDPRDSSAIIHLISLPHCKRPKL